MKWAKVSDWCIVSEESHKNGSRLNYAGIKKFKEKGVIKP